MQKDPNTIWTRAENRPNRKPKNCFTSPLESNLKQPRSTSFGATENMPSLCKHHVDTADAKRPKHHLDTSWKPPKPQTKKLFHVTFGIHIKQALAPQSTCPAYANTIWTLQMQKDPNTIWTRAENRPDRKPKNCFTIWTRAENRPNRKPKNAFTSPLEAT